MNGAPFVHKIGTPPGSADIPLNDAHRFTNWLEHRADTEVWADWFEEVRAPYVVGHVKRCGWAIWKHQWDETHPERSTAFAREGAYCCGAVA